MSDPGATSLSRPPRLKSLDAPRGFDMLWIVGLSKLFIALAAVTSIPWLDAWADQLEHVPWDGLRAYDLIFPLFMFLAGMAIPYSLAAKQSRPGGAIRSILLRVALLILLGAIYNGLLQLKFDTQRYASVLGQIGVAYAIAAFIFLFTRTWKSRVIWLLGLLLGIAALQLLFPVPGHGAGVLTPEGIVNAWIDRQFLPGRLHGGNFDPEGLLCAVSASALTLGGVLTGSFIRHRGPRLTNVPILLAAGAVLILLGWLCWTLGYPPIKSAWTTTFNLLAGGICLSLFALFHLAIDFIPAVNWSFPLQVVGMNPLTIYLAARILPFSAIAAFFAGGLAERSGPWSPVILLSATLLIEWLLLLFLYRKKIFLRV